MGLYRFKPSINPCERNKQIAESRGFYKIKQRTKTAYYCDGKYLYVKNGDFQGLTLEEIKQLTPCENTLDNDH